LGKRDRTRVFFGKLPPSSSSPHGKQRGRYRAAAAVSSAGPSPDGARRGGERRRKARGFDSRPYLGPGRREDAGRRKRAAAVSGARRGGAGGSERELGAVVETVGEMSCTRGRFIGE
jgi:hypothetical protein